MMFWILQEELNSIQKCLSIIKQLIANPDGRFLTSVKLREGINTISIKAVNKLNKETEKVPEQ